jgi:hypothetical protein
MFSLQAVLEFFPSNLLECVGGVGLNFMYLTSTEIAHLLSLVQVMSALKMMLMRGR